MRIAWFNPFAGLAGDMALGALLDAGASLDAVRAGCRHLGYDGWSLGSVVVDRAGLRGTHVRVEVEEQHHYRRAADIIERIAGAGLPARATERAVATFRRLAEVEGHLHGVAPDDVHFHEVGAVDSIIDTVGVALALEDLGVDEVRCGPVAVGVGTIRAAHGVLPNPAPAVAALLEGAPVRGVDVPMELTTPTGAALVAALAAGWGPVPDGIVRTTGYGAGTRNPPGRPNLLQVMVVDTAGSPTHAGSSPEAGQVETVCLLETNLDDVTGELLGYVGQLLLERGALDVWHTPITMKKSRPAVLVSVLCEPGRAAELRSVLARETGTLGVRQRLVDRWVAPRRVVTVQVDGHDVRVKHGPWGAKAEHDDVAAAALALDRPYRAVRAAAEAAAGAGAAGAVAAETSGQAAGMTSNSNDEI
ncbi:MAG: nickel pincer cofactor biosynthesis protein LarC [Acidimicrobiia bacterium]